MELLLLEELEEEDEAEETLSAVRRLPFSLESVVVLSLSTVSFLLAYVFSIVILVNSVLSLEASTSVGSMIAMSSSCGLLASLISPTI